MQIHCAKWIVPVVSPPIENSAMAIKKYGTLCAIGTRKDVLKKHSAKIIDHDNAILFPGLVNAHTHLEISHLKGAVSGGDGLVPWIRRFVGARKSADDSEIEPAMKRAIEELLSSGVVMVGDISNTLKSVPYLADSPMKGVIFHEVFDLKETDSETLFFSWLARTELLKSLPDMTITLSAHAPCTVSKKLFIRIRDFTQTRNLPTCVHLAECEAENEFYKTGSGLFREWFSAAGAWPWPPQFVPQGTTSTAFLDSIGFLSPRTIAIHCVALSEEDIKILKKSGASVCLCPRSNLYIEGKLPPVEALFKAGVNLALGTDSLASCPDLSLFGEMQCLKKHFPALSSNAILKMATINGARALGINEKFVSFAIGEKPSIMRLAIDESIDDAEEYLVTKGRGKAVERINVSTPKADKILQK